jgi:hypothetical protein
VLDKLWNAALKTHEDGYLLMSRLVINLDNPSASTMYGESLDAHTASLDFASKSLTREHIVSFAGERTANNPPAREHIRAMYLPDIISGSPYVLVVEVNEPLRLVHEQVTRDWMETDIYYFTVVRALKGDIDETHTLSMSFFADTVSPGDIVIIAAERLRDTTERLEGSNMFIMTSRNSVHDISKLDEIMPMIGRTATLLSELLHLCLVYLR